MNLSLVSRLRSLVDGMAGQLVLIMVAALVIAQAASFLAYQRERENAVRVSLGSAAIARTASLARALDQSPADLHADLLEAADTPLFRAHLQKGSAILPSREEHGRLRDMFVNATSQFSSNVRFTYTGGKATQRSDWARIDTEAIAMARSTAELGEMPELDPSDLEHFCLSVQMSDGRWLNVRASFFRPPLPALGHFSIWTLVVLVAIAIPVLLLLGKITKPMRALATASDRFSRGIHTDPLPETGPLEARRTCAAFNRMQARISGMILDRMRTLAAISHDLRTPLTVMRLNAEMLEPGPRKDKLIEQTEELQAMCEAALDYARIDSADDAPRTLNLTALVESVVDDFRDLGKPATMADCAAISVQGRSIGLKRCVRNLIENAVRYGGSATVSVRRGDRSISVIVTDVGPGMPEAQIEAMFEPFRRMEGSRNRETGGAGLGLSIARSIARLHGGDVRLRNLTPRGLEAVLTLPSAVSQAGASAVREVEAAA